MKKNISGALLLLLMIGTLMIFPLTAQFFGEKTQSIEVDNATISPHFLDHENATVVLIYFGYVGCTSICIPALMELSPLYEKVTAKHTDVSFYFVNLNPAQPKAWVEPFAKNFNPDFHGIYASLSEVNKLERDFNLAISTGNEELAHSSNLYLMVRHRRSYVLKRVYITHPYSEKQILHDIERLMK